MGYRVVAFSMGATALAASCGQPTRPTATYDLAPSPSPTAAAMPSGAPTFDDGIQRGARTSRTEDGSPTAFEATIETSMGTITCKLFPEKAPRTVESFVGLATGTKEWLDPRTDTWVSTPAYDGTSFHRVIPGFVIQGGDPRGDGSGEPGFTIADEIWEGAVHDRAGQLCMANRGPNTNGMQFFITDAAIPHLDGGYTIFGECTELDVVHAIAATPRGARDVPTTRVDIRRVTIR